MNAHALKPTAASAPSRSTARKNFFALGLMFWLYERPLGPTDPLDRTSKFAKNPQVARGQHRDA